MRISCLFYHFETKGANTDGNIYAFVWPDETVLLQGHTTTGKDVPIQSISCMEYLSRKAEPIKIFNNPIIKAEIELLWKLGGAELSVVLFLK